MQEGSRPPRRKGMDKALLHWFPRAAMLPHVTWNATRILTLRKRLSLTQEQMAHAIGVTVSTFQRWEKDRTTPSPLACKQLTMLAGGPHADRD